MRVAVPICLDDGAQVFGSITSHFLSPCGQNLSSDTNGTTKVTLDWWRVKWARAWTTSIGLCSWGFFMVLVFWKCLKIPWDASCVSSDQNATNVPRFGFQMTKLCMNEWMNGGTWTIRSEIKPCIAKVSGQLLPTWLRHKIWNEKLDFIIEVQAFLR